MDQQKVHYSDYLHLETLLNAQHPESDRLEQPAHDEMLFIVIHQAYELWFKQLLFETASVNAIMQKPALNDNSPELQTVVHRLTRCATILKVLVHQIDIMESMTPMDFLDFRDLLRPASGFQSTQFKKLEASLGLDFNKRFGKEYYVSQLRPEETAGIKQTEKETSLLQLVNEWLVRMPFFGETENWKHFKTSFTDPVSGDIPVFWQEYRFRYQQSLVNAEASNLELFDRFFFHPGEEAGNQGLLPSARRSALFIMLYRGYPVLQLPFQLLNQLLEIDEQLSTWRYRHMSMVHRMIGSRVGTGGSSGAHYLKGALDQHSIFREVAQLTSFLIERKKLPGLSDEMEKRLGFSSHH